MRRLILLVLLLLACSKSGGGDWTKKKLVEHVVTLDGVKFAIMVPEGLPKDGRNEGDWSDAKMEHDWDPKVFTSIVTSSMYENADKAIEWDIGDKAKKNWVRKETRADGFALTDIGKDKHRVEASTFKKIAGDKLIKCTAVQIAEEGDLPSYDATRAMLEKICDSVTPK